MKISFCCAPGLPGQTYLSKNNVRPLLKAARSSLGIFVPEAASQIWRKSEASHWVSGHCDQIDHDDT